MSPKQVRSYKYISFFLFLFIFTFTPRFALAQSTGIKFGAVSSTIPGCPYFFNNELKVGSTGIDVKILQSVLNADRRTRVAFTGPGSRGNETLKFGVATREALKRFQALFIEYVGIADGKLNARTVSIINNICNTKKTPIITKPSDKTPPEIVLSTSQTALSSMLKVNLTSNEIIKKPLPSSIICDGCQIADIRKLSPVSYTLLVIPNEGVRIVEVQIEAFSVEDISGNKNQAASNIVTFRPPTIIESIVDTVKDLTTGLFDNVTDIFSEEPVGTKPEQEIEEIFPPQSPKEIFKFEIGKNNGEAKLIHSSQRVELKWDYQISNEFNALVYAVPKIQFCLLDGGRFKNYRVNSSGQEFDSPTYSTKYTLTCYGKNDYKTRKHLYVDVISDNKKVPVDISANKFLVNVGDEVELIYTLNGIPESLCTVNGGQFKNESLAIKKIRIFKRTIFTVSCIVNNKIESDSVGIAVTKAFKGLYSVTGTQPIGEVENIKSAFSTAFINYNRVIEYSTGDFYFQIKDKENKLVKPCDQKYIIDWGDGSEEEIGKNSGKCLSQFKHSYNTNGVYPIIIYDKYDKIVYITWVSISLTSPGSYNNDAGGAVE